MKLERLTVGDMMTTALITLNGTEQVTRADVDMKLANVRHIPVIDDRGHCIGILSNRDVLAAVGADKSVRVGDVMTKQIYTVKAETAAHEAAELMIEHKIGALPVIGDEEQLVGIVTETDFLIVAHRALSDAD